MSQDDIEMVREALTNVPLSVADIAPVSDAIAALDHIEARLHAAEEQATALFKFNDELRAERDRLREALGRVIYRTDPDWTELAALSSTQEDFDKEYREVEGDAPEWNG